MGIKVGQMYFFVKDLDRAIKFYENFLNQKLVHRFKNRWASFKDFGLYNPSFDLDIIQSGDYEVHMDENYKKFVENERLQIGNNAILTCETDDIEAEHKRAKTLGPSSITEVMYVNFISPYCFFHIQDPDGNTIEVYSLKEK